MLLSHLQVTNALQIQPYHQVSLSQDLTILHPAPRNGLLMRSMESSAWKDSHNSNEAEELEGFSRQLVLQVAGCDDVLGPWLLTMSMRTTTSFKYLIQCYILHSAAKTLYIYQYSLSKILQGRPFHFIYSSVPFSLILMLLSRNTSMKPAAMFGESSTVIAVLHIRTTRDPLMVGYRSFQHFPSYPQ